MRDMGIGIDARLRNHIAKGEGSEVQNMLKNLREPLDFNKRKHPSGR